MRIAELTAFHAHIRLKHEIRHASQTRSDNDTLIVKCQLDDGSTGWGEGLPRPYVTGESIETAWQHLSAEQLPEQLAGNFDDFRGAVALCDRIRLPRSGGTGLRDCFGNSVRCAIELSLLDAAGRAFGQPLSAVTALLPETIGIRQPADSVRYSAAITAMSPGRQRLSAWKIRLYGFRQCKVKAGVEGVDDVASLRRIRRILSDRVDLRIDANEAWTCENLREKLHPLLPFGITSLEQPVPHAEVGGLSKLRGQIDVPLMLDESLCSLDDGRRAIEMGLCDLFNLRLSKNGGFINSLRLAGMAHRAGLGYQLGCQVGETGILSAAGRHFATSVGGVRYLEGSYDRHLVKDRLTVEDVTFGYGGCAPVIQGAGSGVRLSERHLAARTKRQLIIRPRN